MRIVVDLQGAQTGSRFRGIGRYTLSLAQAMARQAGNHELWVTLSEAFPASIEPLRAAFAGLIPPERIVTWQPPSRVADADPANHWRRQAGERLREAVLAELKPDVVHATSLFEGLGSDALTSVGAYAPLPTAVTLYDLIPYIHRTPYLADPRMEAWYLRKVSALRRADCLLAISESARREGIHWLHLPPDRVVNISGDADAIFRPLALSAEEAESLRQRHGLTRPFVMYTGGIDHRKNIEGLIRAYAKLSPGVRAAHQLAIVCSMTDDQATELRALVKRCGLKNSEVVFTGFIPDDDLVALYNLCTVFVFPSWHEGFGLPALEAMRCGAAVIAANTSSLPEVVGREDALFDPHSDDSIAAKLESALVDDAFRQSLKDHAAVQARKFSWDSSARRALDALEHLHARSAPAVRPVVAPGLRPRLAYVSPLPPLQTGIADYSAELLPELARHYDIDVVVQQEAVSDPWIQANCRIRSADWFQQHADGFDRIVYHFGNSAFHEYMFPLLERHPGVVVLHDFYLSSLLAHVEFTRAGSTAWTQALYDAHGYAAVAERAQSADPADVTWKYPANLRVLRRADGVIVHSDFSRRLAADWYGEAIAADWRKIPLLRALPARVDRRAARAALGIPEDAFVVCSFGMLGPLKLNHRLVEAWRGSSLAQDPRCRLIFVGENNPGAYGRQLQEAIGRSGSASPIKITGFAPRELYQTYLAAADAAVQLRTLSRGETSASLLDCMGYGIATITNAHGATAEIPADCVWHLPDEFSVEELGLALESLRNSPEKRAAIGERARHEIHERHHPFRVGDQYREAIEHFAAQGAWSRRKRLLSSIAAISEPVPGDKDLLEVAQAVSASLPEAAAARQLLVDVSELVQRDARSGIQRVVRNVLTQLLRDPPTGFRVEPVYFDDDGHYRYARGFTLDFLACPKTGFVDEVLEARPGDVFLGLDFAPDSVLRQGETQRPLMPRGVEVFFVVYDLLCLKRPDCFSPALVDNVERWLKLVSARADGLICISRAVADELSDWVESAKPPRGRPLRIGWFHLGAEFDDKANTGGPAEPVPATPAEGTTILMVSTLEPRKGYAQALAAFELLWERNEHINLVIVGKQGWLVDELASRIRSHPEIGRRLFWFEQADDATLMHLYRGAHGLLSCSEGEGFGLPLIEAARFGLPILARDLPVFREVAGDSASYFSGSSPAALADALSAWCAAVREGKAPSSREIESLSWAQSTQQLRLAMLGGNWYKHFPAPQPA